MTDYMALVRRDHVAEQGVVAAVMGEVVQLRRADGSTVAFKAGKAATMVATGNDVCVIAVRDTDRAVVVLDRTTGLRHRAQLMRGNTGAGFQRFGKATAWFNFIVFMIPVLGQLAAIAGLFGALVGVLVERQMKGSPPASPWTLVAGVAVYLLGSAMFYGHWIAGGSAFVGFATMVVGAAVFCFLAPRSRLAFGRAMEAFIDEHQRPGDIKAA